MLPMTNTAPLPPGWGVGVDPRTNRMCVSVAAVLAAAGFVVVFCFCFVCN